MLQTTIQNLQEEMRSTRFYLASIRDQQIIIRDNLVIAAQITTVLWYKVRIWFVNQANQDKPKIMQYVESFVSLKEAKTKMNQMIDDFLDKNS